MDHRMPLQYDTVRAFEGMHCHVESLLGQGSNALVYTGWYPDHLQPELTHRVLIKELFPFHPSGKIHRDENGCIVVEPEALDLWQTHRKSFEAGNQVHLRLIADHPERMVMGANVNSFCFGGTLYTVLGYTGGRDLQTELNRTRPTLRQTAQRMIALLDALQAFHQSGYLHLDISPDNIMLVGQGEQERIFLIDYNSTREVGSLDGSYLSCKAGYSPPEVSTGNLRAIGFGSDLYSVAAVFYRCLMGRPLTLADTLQPKAPDGQDSPLLQDVPQTVSNLVGKILQKGLHTLPLRRYRSIGQMRLAFQELIDRIDCIGVTHWALWETGRRSVEDLIRRNPSLNYLNRPEALYPMRLERQAKSLSLEAYRNELLSPAGASGLILARGGMGKTTLLLHTATLSGKHYTPTAPAIFYISLNGWHGADPHFIRRQILLRLRFKPEENTFDSAMHALHTLLSQPLKSKAGELPAVLLLLDGLNEIRGDIGPLIQEINDLNALAGVRILAASRSEIPALELEPSHLTSLHVEDLEQALSRSSLLIPGNPEVLELLRTPLILSIYIQASDGRQLDIHSEAQLMQAYLESLLQKEVETLPADSPERWQTDAALFYVLPAIAAETTRKHTVLTRQELLRTVENCWNTLDTAALRRAFPRWIGHSAHIRANAENPEQWFGIIIHRLLWQRLGMLIQDADGSYRIFHQSVEEYLAGCRVPLRSRQKRNAVLGCLLLCAVLLTGAFVRQNRQEEIRQRQAIEAQLKDTLELGVSGYAEYGRLYQPLRQLTDAAQRGNFKDFQTLFDGVCTAVQSEQAVTSYEQTELLMLADTGMYDQYPLSFCDPSAPYEYELLRLLLQYPDTQANLYAPILPAFNQWMHSDYLKEKVPGFADALSSLLEADADVAAELYHRCVGLTLSGADPLWTEQINDLIASFSQLDSHRDTLSHADRGQRLNTLTSVYLVEKGNFDAVFSKLRAYIRTLEQSAS